MIQTIFPTRPNAAARARLLAFTVPMALLLSLTGCTELTRGFVRPEPQPAPQVAEKPKPAPIPKPQEKPKPGRLYEWNGDGRRVTHIVVDTNEQRARFYDGDEQIGWTTVASGVSKRPTPVGEFEVLEKVKDKHSNLYGKIVNSGGKVVRRNATAGKDAIPAGGRFVGAKMPYFLRVTYDGIGLHAGPIPHPGRPASHGCIRMPSKMAPILYKHTDIGTRVSIVGKGPDYGDYAAKQRTLAAQRARIAAQQTETRVQTDTVAATTSPVASASPSAPVGETPPSSQEIHETAPAAATAETGVDTPTIAGTDRARTPDRPETGPRTATSEPTSAPDATTESPIDASASMAASQPEHRTQDVPPSVSPAPPAPHAQSKPQRAATPMPAPYPPMVPAGAYGPAPMRPIMPAMPPRVAPRPAVATSTDGAASPSSAPTDQGSSSAN